MFGFLKRIFSPPIPDVGLTPREIDINLTPQSQAALRRHAGRLSRVFTMKQTADTKAEIKLRQRALKFAGFNAPKTASDAKQILKQLEVSHGYHT
jgi:hypothetical protein